MRDATRYTIHSALHTATSAITDAMREDSDPMLGDMVKVLAQMREDLYAEKRRETGSAHPGDIHA